MSKKSPFDYVKGINNKTYDIDLSGYVPFLTNRAFAMHPDTIMLAEEMNQAHHLSPLLQYEFYYYGVRRGKRFGFPPKVKEDSNLQLIQEYFQYSAVKAQQALDLLTDKDIKDIRNKMDKGGRV